jgi:hypothetical protein
VKAPFHPLVSQETAMALHCREIKPLVINTLGRVMFITVIFDQGE